MGETLVMGLTHACSDHAIGRVAVPPNAEIALYACGCIKVSHGPDGEQQDTMTYDALRDLKSQLYHLAEAAGHLRELGVRLEVCGD